MRTITAWAAMGAILLTAAPAMAQGAREGTLTRNVGADGTRVETTTRVVDPPTEQRPQARAASQAVRGEATRWPAPYFVVPADRDSAAARRVDVAPLPEIAPGGNYTRTDRDTAPEVGIATPQDTPGGLQQAAPHEQVPASRAAPRANRARTRAPARAARPASATPPSLPPVGLPPVATTIQLNPVGRDAFIRSLTRDQPIDARRGGNQAPARDWVGPEGAQDGARGAEGNAGSGGGAGNSEAGAASAGNGGTAGAGTGGGTGGGGTGSGGTGSGGTGGNAAGGGLGGAIGGAVGDVVGGAVGAVGGVVGGVGGALGGALGGNGGASGGGGGSGGDHGGAR